MKIALLNDLHLESRTYNIQQAVLECDVIVLAGDIAPGSRGLLWAMDILPFTKAEIIYVLGNHEFYHFDITQVREQLKAMCDAYQAGPAGNRVHLLDDSEIIIKGVRFLGSTLWTDFMLFSQDHQQDCINDASRYLNDFRLIKNGARNFTPQDSIELHRKSLAFLEHKLKEDTYAGSTVVVTHHAPSFNSVVPKYADDSISACFASNLDRMFGYSRLWLHGHMHDSLDYTVNGTRIICNPRGYGRHTGTQENDNFNHALILEVD
ncbi:MAG TPA: metallophosphoesterase [Methylophilaceae bacterium]|nr:metallophosphoesterase [Methylophilaceae bacterium]